jgi:hypothetical protein
MLPLLEDSMWAISELARRAREYNFSLPPRDSRDTMWQLRRAARDALRAGATPQRIADAAAGYDELARYAAGKLGLAVTRQARTVRKLEQAGDTSERLPRQQHILRDQVRDAVLEGGLRPEAVMAAAAQAGLCLRPEDVQEALEEGDS